MQDHEILPRFGLASVGSSDVATVLWVHLLLVWQVGNCQATTGMELQWDTAYQAIWALKRSASPLHDRLHISLQRCMLDAHDSFFTATMTPLWLLRIFIFTYFTTPTRTLRTQYPPSEPEMHGPMSALSTALGEPDVQRKLSFGAKLCLEKMGLASTLDGVVS